MTGRRRARRVARIFLVDDLGRVLLLRGGDPRRPDAGTWWFTPGGELEPDEAVAEAARRELREETGLEVADVGPIVLHRDVEHEFDGVIFEQSEDYFLICTPHFALDDTGWTSVERSTIVDWRWWPRADLAVTSDIVFPANLSNELDKLLGTELGSGTG